MEGYLCFILLKCRMLPYLGIGFLLVIGSLGCSVRFALGNSDKLLAGPGSETVTQLSLSVMLEKLRFE